MKCTIQSGEQTFLSGRPGQYTVSGYYVTVPTPMGNSKQFVEHLSQAMSIIGKYDNEADFIKEQKELFAACSEKWWSHGT